MGRAKTKTPAQLREYERKRDFGKTSEPAPRRRRGRKQAPRFVVHLEGKDLTGQPYGRRRALLDGLELEGEAWQTPACSTGHIRELREAGRERGLPGLVLKRLDSVYEPGRRSGAWRELPN